ncbi:WD repeat domain phosphoinositide-interacting protein 3, partial [Gonapodya sp. JEL0774]
SGTCFTLATEDGFRVNVAEPCRERVRRDVLPTASHETSTSSGLADGLQTLPKGGISIASLLGRSNIVALVGGGKSPRWPPDRVVLWDDALEKVVAEIECRADVRAVKMTRDMCKLVAFDSGPNPHAVLAICAGVIPSSSRISTSSSPKSNPGAQFSSLAVFPGFVAGHLQVVDLLARPKPAVVQLIRAHESDVRCVALSRDGMVVATASVKGTLIRIHHTRHGTLLHQLRRGAEPADIFSLAISTFGGTPGGSSGRLAVAAVSDRGTVHVWDIATDGQEGSAVQT